MVSKANLGPFRERFKKKKTGPKPCLPIYDATLRCR